MSGAPARIVLGALVVAVIANACLDRGGGDSGRSNAASGTGYVVYVAGISLVPLGFLRHGACDRADEDFSEELRAIAERTGVPDESLAPVCFSYSRTSSDEYTSGDTGQSLEVSAGTLDQLITELRDRWQAAGRDGDPEILILGHSLGGAVASLWASEATVAQLAPVSAVVTFNSPLRGLDDSQLQYWAAEALFAPAVEDLQDPEVVARITAGTGRVRSIQVGGTEDLLVPAENSFTARAWRAHLATCGDLLKGPLDGHECSLADPATLAFVEDALESRFDE